MRTTRATAHVPRAQAAARYVALGIASLLLVQFPLAAQTAFPEMAAMTDTSRARLQPLKWLVGEWVGPATGSNGGQSFTVTQHEKVIEGANGTVLLIQGRGAMGERTVFEAAGLISYDVGSRQFKWVSSGGTGHLGVSQAQVRGDTLVWTAPSGPSSRTRYTIWRSPKGEWREVGEATQDDKTWTKTFDMTLVKK
ncbi:MAG: hypothetical protein H7Z40_08200 [Phycisphaerae bacterium]|nr:hypothetical protein [Gemmatimonadaceae bacterium]